MSALRRASRRLGGTVASVGVGARAGVGAGFERGRVSAVAAGGGLLRLAPVLAEPGGFAVDLERALVGMQRRALIVEPYPPGPQLRRSRGRWPRTPFHLPGAARMRIRDRGRRR